MTIMELQQILTDQKVRPDSYSLNGGIPNEVYCLRQTQDSWEVHYSARGDKSRLKIFENELDACDYLFDLLVRQGALIVDTC